ncbi:MAG TPA: molybdopterin-guanine dinucleotide biosynthesis protein B [Beijerinckiaceae bacterium]|jgi:molybdopterin-guanine dinucleotide biosynthesis protein B
MKIIGLAGWSGAGKTTALAAVIPRLVAAGLRVSTIKHAHHAFDVDTPGKDSWTHRQAGASEVLVASANRFALMHELRGAPEWTLPQLLDKLSPVDLVIVEGFKRSGHPKIEIHRAANGKPFLWPDDPDVVGLASDVAPPSGPGRAPPPRVPLDDAAALADMLLRAAADVAAVRARLAASGG